MSFLEEPGDLAEVPLAAVLIEALNQRATGVLTVDHGNGSSKVYVRDGIPVGAQSFRGFKPLGQVLLAAGVIDVEALGKSLAEMARSGRQQGEVLVEMGAASREQVDGALSEQQAGYLTQVAALSSGRFVFDAAAPVPAWTRGIRISPLKAIVEALEKPQAAPLVISALQPVAAGPIALASGYGKLAGAFGWSAAEGTLVDRLQTLTTLDVFFADPGVSPERARAIVAALLLLGLASARSAPADAVETVPGLVVELADLAGVPVESEAPAPAARTTPAPASAAPAPAAPVVPLRRSDPEEARRRRQRLLQRAMQNMGVGPLSGLPPTAAAVRHAEAAASAAASAAAGTGTSTRPAATSAEVELRRALEAAAPRARMPDLFERLGLPRTATREQVKAAYFQLAKQLHPDRFASPTLADLAQGVKDLFAAVNEAYETLSDDKKRLDYLARTGGASPAAAAKDADRQGAAMDFQKAEACARTRDYGKARGFYEAALRADPRPEYQAAYAWMLTVEPRGADRVRARSLAEAALRDPACDRAALVCAVLARDEGDDEKAERLLRRALQANPRNADAERELRALEARRGKAKTSGLSGLFKKR
jgi:curved DNA-binding protein CbpA